MTKRKLDQGLPDWYVTEYVDPKSGDVVRKYTYKNRGAIRVPLKSGKALQVAGYHLIEKDLRNIEAWVREIQSIFEETRSKWETVTGHQKSPDRKLFQRIKGLFVASVTVYGKCFTECKGRRVKLERDWVDEQYREEHDSIIMFRNNFAAHSGDAKVEKCTVCVVVDSKKTSAILPITTHELEQPDSISLNDINSFEELRKHVHGKVKSKVATLYESLHAEVFSKGSAFWRNGGGEI